MLDPDRTLEVRCGSCRAKFRPWHRANDSGLQPIQVNRCGLCEGDPLMKLMYAGCEVQLVARNDPWNSQDDQSQVALSPDPSVARELMCRIGLLRSRTFSFVATRFGSCEGLRSEVGLLAAPDGSPSEIRVGAEFPVSVL
jgi:hypothetical protein